MITFNSQLTIDGLITGLSVFGAFLGYVINLISKYRSKKKEKREKADRLTVMEILETDLMNGLTEVQVKELFYSESTKDFRKSAGASKPSKLKDEDFSKYLRDLQWSHMIYQVDQLRYRLIIRPIDKYEMKGHTLTQIREFIKTKNISVNLSNVMVANFDKFDKYEQRKFIETVGVNGLEIKLDSLVNDLNSTDESKSVQAAKQLLDILID